MTPSTGDLRQDSTLDLGLQLPPMDTSTLMLTMHQHAVSTLSIGSRNDHNSLGVLAFNIVVVCASTKKGTSSIFDCFMNIFNIDGFSGFQTVKTLNINGHYKMAAQLPVGLKNQTAF